MAIRCCNGCVPPKRHLACWETCPDYAREKEKHRAEKERIKKSQARRAGHRFLHRQSRGADS